MHDGGGEACMVVGGCAWLQGAWVFAGGMHGCRGACVVAVGGMHGCGGGACMVVGACVVAGGVHGGGWGGGHAWDMTRYGQ